MKVISNLHTKLCRVECTCCGEGHDLDFAMPSKKYLIDEYFLYLLFRQDGFSLKDRIRQSHNFVKHKKNLQESKMMWDGVIVEYDQLADLYSTLKLEYEQNDLLHEEDLSPLEKINFVKTADSTENFNSYIIFSSKEGLVIEVMANRYLDRKPNPEGKLVIENISIGYSIKDSDSRLNRFKRIFKYIFNQNKGREHWFFTKNEVSLSKEEFIQFNNTFIFYLIIT
jgi:hypothetical protein